MGGIASWPDAGGVAQQAAWIIDGFALLAGIDAALEAEAKTLQGG
jgi:hypothetical protein